MSIFIKVVKINEKLSNERNELPLQHIYIGNFLGYAVGYLLSDVFAKISWANAKNSKDRTSTRIQDALNITYYYSNDHRRLPNAIIIIRGKKKAIIERFTFLWRDRE